MNITTKTTDTIDALDAIMDAGFGPADDGDDTFPTWLADSWDGAISFPSGNFLVAGIGSDALNLALLTKSGVIISDIHFSAPDGIVSALDLLAFDAVVSAWAAAAAAA